MTKLIENKRNIGFKDKKGDFTEEKTQNFSKLYNGPKTLKGNKTF